MVTYKMEGEKSIGSEKFRQVAWNGKVYASKKDIKMNWILNVNERKEDEWCATNLGLDQFTKIK